MEKKASFKFKELEILRGITLLDVVLAHTANYYAVTTNDLIILVFLPIRGIDHFPISTFLFLSGFLLTMRDENINKWSSFYKKRFKNILPPYLIFSLLYIIYSYYIVLKTPFELTYGNIMTVGIQLLTASAFYHLWYFGLIFQFYLLYPIFNKIVKKYENKLFWILIISIFLQIIWSFIYVILINSFKSYQDENIAILLATSPLRYFFFSHIGFFVLGVYFNKNYERILKIFKNIKFYFNFLPILFLLSILSYILWFFTINGTIFNNIEYEIYYLILNIEDQILYYFITIFLLIVSIYLSKKNSIYKKLFIKFGQYSLGVYLIHAIIIIIIKNLLQEVYITYNHWQFYAISFILVPFISLIIIYVISLLPYHKYLIGKIRKWDK